MNIARGITRTAAVAARTQSRGFANQRVEVKVADMEAFVRSLPRTHHAEDPHRHLALSGKNWSPLTAHAWIASCVISGAGLVLAAVHYQQKKGGFYEKAAKGEA